MNKPKILIVEDIDQVREICVKKLLDAYGTRVDVIGVAHPPEATKIMDEDASICMLLTDINCGPANDREKDGIWLMKWARTHLNQRIKTLPIVAMSGRPENEELVIDYANHFFYKDFTSGLYFFNLRKFVGGNI